jgi:hypothetical protein
MNNNSLNNTIDNVNSVTMKPPQIPNSNEKQSSLK